MGGLWLSKGAEPLGTNRDEKGREFWLFEWLYPISGTRFNNSLSLWMFALILYLESS